MKLEINHKKNTEKHAKTWKLNNMLLNNKWVNNETKEEIKLSWNKWKWEYNTGKAILREKFIALQAYIKKQEKLK